MPHVQAHLLCQVNLINACLVGDTSKKLRLIDTVRKVDGKLSPQILKLKTEYKNIFTGFGKLKGVKVRLHIDTKTSCSEFPENPFPLKKIYLKKQLKLD